MSSDRIWSAVTDLELLAKWARRFYGSGLLLQAAVQTSQATREEREDEHRLEFHRVTETHRRFEAMRCFAGRLHYAVLWWAYIERGAFSRMPFDTFCEDLGWHFANAKQRKSWNEKRPSVRSGAPREYGKKLHAAAVKAFENNACAFV